ncbi:hypothetical protein [Enterococcus sp. AZ012]|uniref:hypothetical protein n=1 Tax=unclassified Enterococcus TaxID=2608891 RepID=UPI003D2C3257
MKYLKIENNQGFFLRENDMIMIDKITKEDIFNLISLVISTETEFDMDEFSEKTLQHGVHKIIYKSIYDKLLELIKDKENIQDSVNQQFATALQKYSTK